MRNCSHNLLTPARSVRSVVLFGTHSQFNLPPHLHKLQYLDSLRISILLHKLPIFFSNFLPSKMDSAPPPYTREPESQPWASRTMLRSPGAIQDRLHRFLIDSIVFAYGLDNAALRATLARTILSPDDQTNDADLPAPSILSKYDREQILHLATVLRDTCAKIDTHSYSIITNFEVDIIFSDIIIPARTLSFKPSCAIKLLCLYADHKGEEVQKVGHYCGRLINFSFLPSWGWCLESQASLARRVISDDLLVEWVSPNAQTQQLLGQAVADFAREKVYRREKGLRTRCFYASDTARALVEFVDGQKAGLV
jgi:hypothetical protein